MNVGNFIVSSYDNHKLKFPYIIEVCRSDTLLSIIKAYKEMKRGDNVLIFMSKFGDYNKTWTKRTFFNVDSPYDLNGQYEGKRRKLSCATMKLYFKNDEDRTFALMMMKGKHNETSTY